MPKTPKNKRNAFFGKIGQIRAAFKNKWAIFRRKAEQEMLSQLMAQSRYQKITLSNEEQKFLRKIWPDVDNKCLSKANFLKLKETYDKHIQGAEE